MTATARRLAYGLWLAVIVVFALVHALHLSADFPNHSPWSSDWAKYTDEGWYGNAAVRAHLFGKWYLPGDFNPAPAVPVWPFLEWVLFNFTGVSMVAARSLAVAFFFVDMNLSYLLLRARGPRWMALLALTLAVTSPFLYAFSRLAILEPMLIALLLAALNLAVRLPSLRRPVAASAVIGLLFTLMLLTKTSAAFLLPAIAWAVLTPLWAQRRVAIRCALAAGMTAAASFALWMLGVLRAGLMADYRYLFFINRYIKPKEYYWPALSLWWSFHGGLWADRLLIPLAGVVFLAALFAWRTAWSRRLRHDPVFGASVLVVAGYVLFMTYQNHPQPRYFTVVALFSLFVLVVGAQAILAAPAEGIENTAGNGRGYAPHALDGRRPHHPMTRLLGMGVLAVAVLAAGFNAVWTLTYAAHPEYTFINAARQLTLYIDAHPNGNRILVSISGDDITMITRLPSLCDDFGTQELSAKLGRYQPGWWATWNDIDPGTLEDLHTRYSLEQVATFRAFDDPDRNQLVLFKLHALAEGEIRDPSRENLQVPLLRDKIDIPVQ